MLQNKELHTTRFDRPVFKLIPMDHPMQWANVSNKMSVTHRGNDYSVYTEVPTSLFPILAYLEISVDSTVSVFLEDDGPKMLFGIIVDEDSEEPDLFDLWHYTMDLVPKEFL